MMGIYDINILKVPRNNKDEEYECFGYAVYKGCKCLASSDRPYLTPLAATIAAIAAIIVITATKKEKVIEINCTTCHFTWEFILEDEYLNNFWELYSNRGTEELAKKVTKNLQFMVEKMTPKLGQLFYELFYEQLDQLFWEKLPKGYREKLWDMFLEQAQNDLKKQLKKELKKLSKIQGWSSS